MEPLRIQVRDMAALPLVRPVTGGVPLAPGEAPRGAVFALTDGQGVERALQAAVLRRWADGSAQWVLLDFQSTGSEEFFLSCSEGAPILPPSAARIRVSRGAYPALRSGAASAVVTERGTLLLSDRLEVHLSLTAKNGAHCPCVLESVAFETLGPLRSSMVLSGAFIPTSGERVFGFRLRVTLFAGLSAIRLEPMILIDAARGMMQKVRGIELHMRTCTPIASGVIGGQPAWAGTLTSTSGVRLFQRDDRHYEFDGGQGGAGERAPGWVEFADGLGPVAAAVTDFWQRWPKGIALRSEGAVFELLPRFRAGAFKHMEPWYKYQYLFEGVCYRLRTGQARRWELWVEPNGKGQELAACANAPLVPAADPVRALATGVWGDIAPAGAPGLQEYDGWAADRFEEYLRSIAVQRDYGEMNWGDWFGERHVNWGNHEYDTSNVILTQFARTGDPRYFHIGQAAGRHTSEVDTIHFVNDDLREYFQSHFGNPSYPVRPGMMHEHCIGHVGGFYSVEQVRRLFVSFDIGRGVKRPYLCLDPYNLGHVFTRGMTRLYFLTGDPWLKETVLAVGDNLAKLVLDREFDGFKRWSHSGRVNGWTMQALAPPCEIVPAHRYLRAMRILADDALEEQDPNCGGWLYELPHGHCFCKMRKHVGEAGFIGCVRMNGLCLYYRLTGDKRVPAALKRYVDFLIADTWDERLADWRYTSCPASNPINQIGVTIMTMVHSARITGEPEHIRILKKAWQAKFDRLRQAAKSPKAAPGGAGKTYSLTMYGSGEAAALFAETVAGNSEE